MNTIKPRFYDNFICSADKCTYNCCRDWAIHIDDATFKKYSSYGEDYSAQIVSSDGSHMIRMDREGICPFQTSSGLCRIVEGYGEEGLSESCKTFPRNYSVYYGCIEYGLSCGCPEVVRIIGDTKGSIEFENKEMDENEKYPKTANPFFSAELIPIRDLAIEILQIPDVDFVDKFLLVFQMAIETTILDMDTVMNNYSNVDYVVNALVTIRSSSPKVSDYTIPMMKLLSKTVNAGLKNTYGYKNIIKDLDDVASNSTEEMLFEKLANREQSIANRDRFYENISVNYLYTNGALKPGEQPFYHNVAILLFELGLIRYYDMLASIKTDKESSICDITSYYARCFENIGSEAYTLIKALEEGKTLPFSLGYAILK